jgi:hypothetical protein
MAQPVASHMPESDGGAGFVRPVCRNRVQGPPPAAAMSNGRRFARFIPPTRMRLPVHITTTVAGGVAPGRQC